MLAACGRLDFQSSSPSDGGATDAARGYATPSIVQTEMTSDVASTLVVALDPARANDVLVVAIAGYHTVGAVSDDRADAFVQAAAQGDENNDDTEIWYAVATGGATTVTVTMSANNNVVWVLELGGVDVAAPVVAARGASTTSTTTAIATGAMLATSIAGSVVVATGAGGDPFDTLRAGPFTALPFAYGDDTAYDITAAPGSFAASWDVTPGNVWSISTAAFAPAPR